MTDQHGLLAAVIADPADDLPRMLYADFLDENGEGKRAEFIRVQLQLARPKMDCHHARPPAEAAPWCEVCQLRRREYELARVSSWWPSDWLMKFDRDTFRYERRTAYVGRGFIRRIRCSWVDWLKAAESIYWHPSQTVECPACGGDGYQEDGMNARPCRKCRVDGRSAGRIARPCPLTAQPLEEVEFTTWMPRVQLIRRSHEPEGFFTTTDDGAHLDFDRLKCETCDGKGTQSVHAAGGHGYRGPCLDCHGEPLNRWTCPLWPSLVFVMPENSPQRRSR